MFRKLMGGKGTTPAAPPPPAVASAQEADASDADPRVVKYGGNQIAASHAEELRRGDWPAIEMFLLAQTDSERRDWYVSLLAAEVPGRPAWIDEWVAARPGQYLPLLFSGCHKVVWAWEARGRARAKFVQPDAWPLFHQRLNWAMDDLQAAAETAPGGEAGAYVFMLAAAMGLSYDKSEIMKIYAQAQQRRPWHRMVFTSTVQALAKKWGGSTEMMLDFARTTRNSPIGSGAPYALLSAHLEASWEAGACEFYWAKPGVKDDIRWAADRLTVTPAASEMPLTVHTAVLWTLARIGDREGVRRELDFVRGRLAPPISSFNDPVAVYRSLLNRWTAAPVPFVPEPSRPVASAADADASTFAPRLVSYGGDLAAAAYAEHLANGDWQVIEGFLAQQTNSELRDWYVSVLAGEVTGCPDWVDRWVAERPGQYLPLLFSGQQKVTWAWEVRSKELASGVKLGAWPIFFERLESARSDLEAAADVAAESEAGAWAFLIPVLMGLQAEKNQVHALFEEVQRRRPWHQLACMSMVEALAEKWGGSEQMMFEFALATKDAPVGSGAPIALLSAHFEAGLAMYRAGTSEAEKARWCRPGVVEDLNWVADHLAASPARDQAPMSLTGHNLLLYGYNHAWNGGALADTSRLAAELGKVRGRLTRPYTYVPKWQDQYAIMTKKYGKKS